jgi:hypothetical protein
MNCDIKEYFYIHKHPDVIGMKVIQRKKKPIFRDEMASFLELVHNQQMKATKINKVPGDQLVTA